MVNREAAWKAHYTHPWHAKRIKKLAPNDLALAADFIRAYGHLDKGQYQMKVNRMFIDQADKPKNWTLIMDLLICCG